MRLARRVARDKRDSAAEIDLAQCRAVQHLAVVVRPDEQEVPKVIEGEAVGNLGQVAPMARCSGGRDRPERPAVDESNAAVLAYGDCPCGRERRVERIGAFLKRTRAAAC